jgi:hypothetical protein
MKNSNFIVRIPEPCHEEWNNMKPDAKGKFCNSCSKSVFDFSNKTDTEIRDILIEYKDQKVCGHFKKTQIDRHLNISINLRDLPKNISITKAFGIALFLVFGTVLFSCTNEYGQKVNGIEIVDSDKENMIMGDLSFPSPPIQSVVEKSETISGDTIMSMDSLETICFSESYVEGAISIVELLNEEIKPVKQDTDVEELPATIEEPMIDAVITGMFVSDYAGKNDSIEITSKDSTISEGSKKIMNQEDIFKPNNSNIYPNPGNGEFIIKYDVLKRANVNIDIHNMEGVLIRTIVNISNQYEGQYQIPVNLNELPNGIYLVSLVNDGKKSTERLVIEK